MQIKPFPRLTRDVLTTLQINIGYKCNQACSHCHVNAGPHRDEMMSYEIISIIPEILRSYNLNVLDITGGAPEIHHNFR